MSIIGIDAGGTWLKAGLFSDDLTLERSIQVASGAARGVDAYFDMIAQAVQQLGGADAVGLAIPGTLSRDGRAVLYAANVQGLTVADKKPVVLKEALEARLGSIPIVGDNDAGCAALAEWRFGTGQGDRTKSLLQLTWGTGIGTAFVVNGVSQYGWEGGHMPVTWSERADIPCNCGSAFDLEAFIAVPHLVQRAHMPPEALLQQAEAGQPEAQAIIDQALQWLARGIHMMGVLVYPDIVAVGGGFMANDWLLQELRRHMAHEAQGYLTTTLQPDMVHRAQLENDAGIIGAAILAQQHLTSTL